MPVLAEEPCCPCHFHWYKLETMISCFSSLFFVHVDRMTLMVICTCHLSRIKPPYPGELPRDGDTAERLWEPLRPAWNSPWVHQDRDQVFIDKHFHEDQYSPVGAIHLVLFNCREAWLRLSMQYHPDLNPDDEKAANRFLEIKESYTGLIRTLIWQFQCLIGSNISQSWSMMRKGKLTMTR